MNTLNIVKLLIIVSILYLFIRCLKSTENFEADKIDFSKEVELTLTDANSVNYFIVSLENFKPEYQAKLVQYIKEKMPNLTNIDMEISKLLIMPMFLLRSAEVDKYTKGNVSKFRVRNLSEAYKFIPVINGNIRSDQYAYIEPSYGTLVYSANYIPSNILAINKETKKINLSSIVPIKIQDMDVFIFDLTGDTNVRFALKQ
jgi:hypothetical protein